MTDSREALTPDLTEKNMNDGISSPTSGAASARNDKSLDGACESDSSLPPTAGASDGARRASEAVMAGNDSRGGVPLRSSCPAITPDLERALEDARRRLEEVQKVLREHHDWHLQSGDIGLQAHDGEWIAIDNAAEYSDSLMCEHTIKALEGLPPDEAGPMPRGGISAWWWQIAVLERRAKRKAESRITALEARVATLREALAEARNNGLIYWEPNTQRGAAAKALMLSRIGGLLQEGSTRG